jgi:hypothetical protein
MDVLEAHDTFPCYNGSAIHMCDSSNMDGLAPALVSGMTIYGFSR